MKILFTGGGTGGHFYPIIAVAEAMHDIVREERLLEPQLYYAAPDPYDRELLIANNIQFVQTSAGKVRRYFSLLNVTDVFKTGWGIVRSVFRIFFLYPDVVFGKGGYASFPTLLAARLFSIPVVIQESDAVPGRVNLWAGKFARKVAISFPDSSTFFPKEKVALTGNPVRKAALFPARDGAWEHLKLDPNVPVILVIGGSQGAMGLNEVLLQALPELVKHYQIIHQVGRANITEVEGRARLLLENAEFKDRYKPHAYLSDLTTRMSAGVATLVVSRAGSSAIFEIASWGLPSIIVPLPESAQDHQTKNAFAYAHTGACAVVQQNNLTPGLLTSEIARIMGSQDIRRHMSEAARTFSRPDASRLIARALIDIALSHES